MSSAPSRLRALLARPGCHQMPCCFDALSAKLVAAAGFPVTFVSGFSAAAAKGLPDTGLLSYAEMEGVMRRVSTALDQQIPVIGDGDTGYGNAVNAKRTVKGYAAAGLAGIMIEDQVAPKRCGHTKGKEVVDRATAIARIQAAVDASREAAGGREDDSILIVARTDARGTHGLDEALERAVRFREAGADICFVEAPQSVEEMRAICEAVEGPKMANLLTGGLTPVLPPDELEKLGFKLAAYPLDLLNASIVAQRAALEGMKGGVPPEEYSLPFEELQSVVGFPEYYAEADRYKT